MTDPAKPIDKASYVRLYHEVNRLRERDGEQTIGGLAFARKLLAHFHESSNKRVLEAMGNVGLKEEKISSESAD